MKAANILVDSNDIVKIADFGVATFLQENEKANTLVGTKYYMAPEVIDSD